MNVNFNNNFKLSHFRVELKWFPPFYKIQYFFRLSGKVVFFRSTPNHWIQIEYATDYFLFLFD